jgi:hypothetical protein
MSQVGRVREFVCVWSVYFCSQSGGGASIRLLTYQLQSRNWGRRVALNIVIQNDGEFVDLILLWQNYIGMTCHSPRPQTLHTKFSESCRKYSKLNTAIRARKVSDYHVAKNKPFSLDIFLQLLCSVGNFHSFILIFRWWKKIFNSFWVLLSL